MRTFQVQTFVFSCQNLSKWRCNTCVSAGSRLHIPKPLSSKAAGSAGIIPRAVNELVDAVNEAAGQGIQAQLTFSFLQVYMESISDLLKQNSRQQKALQIREDPVHGVYVAGLTQVISSGDAQDVIATIAAAASYRTTHATAQNNTSSRSHALLQFTVEQCMGGKKSSKAPQSVNLRRSTLTLVDLAGSERVHKSRSGGQRLEEAKMINKSISALGNCVAALADGRSQTHVPFRDSKLTRLLTETLGGNAKACICANISPCGASYEETNSTLVFASRALAVRHNAVVNEMIMTNSAENTDEAGQQTMVDELRAQNQQLEAEMSELREKIVIAETRNFKPPPPPQPAPPQSFDEPAFSMENAALSRELQRLSQTVQSLQEQLARKNVQIAQLQHACRNNQQQSAMAGQELMNRLAKQIADFSPLRSHLRSQLYVDEASASEFQDLQSEFPPESL